MSAVDEREREAYLAGANYALYAICSELCIESWDIRIKEEPVKWKVEMIARRIENELRGRACR